MISFCFVLFSLYPFISENLDFVYQASSVVETPSFRSLKDFLLKVEGDFY